MSDYFIKGLQVPPGQRETSPVEALDGKDPSVYNTGHDCYDNIRIRTKTHENRGESMPAPLTCQSHPLNLTRKTAWTHCPTMKSED